MALPYSPLVVMALITIRFAKLASFTAARAALTKSQLVLEVEVLRDHRKQLQVLEQLVRTGSIDPGDKKTTFVRSCNV